MSARRFALAAKAFRELGPGQLWDYARYRSQLRLGFLRRQTVSPPPVFTPAQLQISPDPIFPLPDRQRILRLLGEAGVAQLRSEADEIVAGKARLFGGVTYSPADGSLPAPGALDGVRAGQGASRRIRLQASLGAGALRLGHQPGARLYSHRRRALCRRLLALYRAVPASQSPLPGRAVGLGAGGSAAPDRPGVLLRNAARLAAHHSRTGAGAGGCHRRPRRAHPAQPGLRPLAEQ